MTPIRRLTPRLRRLATRACVLLTLLAVALFGRPLFELQAQAPLPTQRAQAPPPASGAVARAAANTPGSQRPEDTFGYGSTLSPLEARGRDTWYFWTGGNQHFFRQVAILSDGLFDLLQVIDSRRNGQRFRTLGLMTDPGCTPATQADQYGLWLDNCPPDNHPDIPGMPTGVVGLRKFDNPNFDAPKWSLEQYMRHPRNAEPPYLVGMACGFCHIGFDPLKPPDNPERPAWSGLAPTIGNQYLEDAKLFSIRLTPADFRWHVANRQPAGTVDTSRFATDHINNPNAINTIFNLRYRPTFQEKMRDGSVRAVSHILKDGADSIGIAGASLRVYVNIGMCSDYWTTLHQPIYGMAEQKPFLMEKARKECADFRATEARMPAAEAFLKTLEPKRLKDAPGGERYFTAVPEVLRRGKLAFADHCATCHSSKQPPPEIASDGTRSANWLRDSVLSDDFLVGNFLSDDRRYPVSRIGTNIARAVASNAVQGHIWEEFSSETYKEQPSVGKLTGLYNPLDPGAPIDFTLPGGGRGYYRTPSLLSIWATAPYLHNNSVGIFTKDPSLAGRMIASKDGMERLLWPERRLGVESILVTTTPSRIQLFNGPAMNVPVGTAISVIASVNPRALPKIGQRTVNALSWLFGDRFLLKQLMSENLAPDFVEDRGHTFGATLSDEDKYALIEFLKTF